MKRPITVLTALALAAGMLSAQSWYFPYYGKNKVNYVSFDWKSVSTEHFTIYYYFDNSGYLKTLASIAESAYQKISQLLRHQLPKPVPILYYNTYTDFVQTNAFGGDVSGALGISEPLLNRIGIYCDMPLRDLQDLVEHELTHVFEFDLLWGNQAGSLYMLSQPPLWVFEGLSEYNNRKWSSWSSLIVRDAVLNDRIPDLGPNGDLVPVSFNIRPPEYDFGHALYDFMEERFGIIGIREFWQSMKNAPLIGRRDPIKRTFNMKVKEFNQEFKKYLREKNKTFLPRESPEDYSITLGPEFPANPYFFSFSHAVSPSGDLAATITYSVRNADIDIVLLSVRDGHVVKNITKGYSSTYEAIKFDVDVTRGRMLAWSPDGDTIAFFARDGQKYSLILVDPLRGDVKRKIRIPQDQPAAPDFFPNGVEMVYTALDNGVPDIFKINLQTGAVVNLSRDPYFEKAPAVSPDGKLIAYSIHVGDEDKLFLSPVDDLSKKTRLTFGKGNTICPSFAADGKTLYFAGDRKDVYNIYSLNLESGKMIRRTDVRTGNFFPEALRNEPGKILFSSFNKGAFQLFRSSLTAQEEENVTFAEVSTSGPLDDFKPAVEVSVDESKIKRYRGLGNLYVAQRPPIMTSIGSDGGLYGGSSLSFSDLFGDHNFNVTVYQINGYKSTSLSYLNIRNRLQFAANIFSVTYYYYMPYTYLGYGEVSPYYSYKDAIATRTITGLQIGAAYPFSLFTRLEASLAAQQYEEELLNPLLFGPSNTNQSNSATNSSPYYGSFWNGNYFFASVSLVGETTRFNQIYGPVDGSTYKFSLTQGLPLGKSLIRNTTIDVDLRKYLNLGADTVLAFRWVGFLSRGRNPYVTYYGGNNQVRSANLFNLLATEGWYANAELRFTLLSSTPTILGNLGPIRGAVFFDMTRSRYGDYPPEFFRLTSSSPLAFETYQAMGSWGYGLQTFFLGLPIHLEFVKELYFPKTFDFLGVKSFGGFQTKFWIGFDF